MKNKYLRERSCIVLVILVALINITHVNFLNKIESTSFGIASIIYQTISYIIVILLVVKILNEKNSIDNLTRAYTKQRLYSDLKRKIKANERFNVVYVDLDYFKKINDTKGHLAGDKLLVDFVKNLSAFIGENIYRYGGDEFVIITNKEKVNLHEELKQVKQVGFKFSYGISSFVEFFDRDYCKKTPKKSDEIYINLLVEDILQLADDRMYKNKGEKEDRLEN